jgi:putative membrane protein
MIKYNPKLWFTHIFHFYKSDTLRILFPEIILVGLYTWILNYGLHYFFPSLNFKLFKNAYAIHTLVGFVMGMLLVFRTNTAYERWWEGRKLWGSLVNNSRHLAIKTTYLIPESNEQKEFLALIQSFPMVLKHHLRDQKNISEVLLSEEKKQKLLSYQHLPNGLISMMYEKLHFWKENKTLSDVDLLLLDQEIKNFTDIMGACERIKNTPIPFSYTLFIKKFIFIYILTLPLGFIPDFGYWSVLISGFVFYVFVSIELIAEEIEDPFGTDDNDLPTDELSKKIEQNIDEIAKNI